MVSTQDKLLLDIQEIETEFSTPTGVNKAVDKVSLNLKKGETLAIVGESGSGKSVTAMSILKLIPEPPGKSKGFINFNGKLLNKCSTKKCAPLEEMIFHNISRTNDCFKPSSYSWITNHRNRYASPKYLIKISEKKSIRHA